MTNEQYLQIAKKYATKQEYPMVRFIEQNEDGFIYNITDPEEWGRKLGPPTFILVSNQGEVIEINDLDLIYEYKTMLSTLIKAGKFG